MSTENTNLTLETLSPGAGARKVGKRKGRGNASGNGRTAGRGEKGQMARSGGGVRAGFEGGQMPLYRRLPKIGFRSRKMRLGLNQFCIINLSEIESKFQDGQVVDKQSLAEIGCRQGYHQKAGIKILGTGDITKKLTFKVEAVTKSAKEKIEKAGGSVELVVSKGKSTEESTS